MEPQLELITGCSSGIGLALAVKLANDEQKHFKVIATMRNLAKRGALEEAAGDALNDTLEIKKLDVCSDSSIRECMESLPWRHVDILINNAGVGLIGPIECQSIDDMKGVFRNQFLWGGIMSNDIYAASKFAVEGFCESLLYQAMKCLPHQTGCYGLQDPGQCHGSFHNSMHIGVFIWMHQIQYSVWESVTFAGVQVGNVLRVITMEEPPLRHQTNQVYTPVTALKYVDPSGELVNDIFYKLVFHHDTLMQASLHAIKFIRWKASKVQQGARMLVLI
ncbi:hypothetical protein XELAEV_18043159mg [Xenopus laevis]|uniref:Uncharacterized protein n=1 Tax=Xenopus laevis TaxID=8355 RepID=A0A974H2J4_XENLA|nr:hypothetical protein XELAEV_18043159mg [Xenopus laevis]